MLGLGNLEVDFSSTLLEYMYKADIGEKIPIFPRKEVCSTSMGDYKPNPDFEREREDWYKYQEWLLNKIREIKEKKNVKR